MGYRDLTVDDVCIEVGASKGAFYGYFPSKHALLLALLSDDGAEMDHVMTTLESRDFTPVERLRRFVKAMLDRGSDQSRVQVRADLWACAITEPQVRDGLAEIVRQRRARLRRWVQAAIDADEIDLRDVPPNAFASLLLALGDGLMLHTSVDPPGFRWQNVARVLDEVFAALGAA
jgi:AcrR family transcriptional regulator